MSNDAPTGPEASDHPTPSVTDSSVVSRRRFVALSGAAGAVGASAVLGRTSRAHAAGFTSTPFGLGSASGDATTTSVVLWTRLAPSPTSADAGMAGQPDVIDVAWRVAHSYEGARAGVDTVYAGTTQARREHHWSVHVDVAAAPGGGPLQPGRQYWFVFSIPGTGFRTWIGSTRTAPAASTDVAANFAVISCQSAATDTVANNGISYWHGYSHLQDNPVDFVVHLGDYIYREGHANTVPAGSCNTLTDYRQRWGWYLNRDAIQRCRRSYPLYAVPDDHEVFNDFDGEAIPDTFGSGVPDGDGHLRLLNAGLQAYWENMPLRAPAPTAPAGSDKLRLSLEKTLRWGRHLDLRLWDCRQDRTVPSAPSPTMLGSDQRQRTLAWIAGSTATWTVLGSTSPLSHYAADRRSDGSPVPAGVVNWNAYPAERAAITGALRARLDAGGFNPVVISGDIHVPMAARVVQDLDPDDTSFVATEFCGPSMSSYGGGQAWVERRQANPSVFAYVGLADDTSGRAQPQSLKGYLRCSAGASTFYSNYLLTHQTNLAGGAVTSRWKSRTAVGTIGAVPY